MYGHVGFPQSADRGSELSAKEASEMVRVVRCECGGVIREREESALIDAVKRHAWEAHQLRFSDEQVLAMMEIEQ